MRKTIYALASIALLTFQVAGLINPAAASAANLTAPETPKTKVSMKLNIKSYSAIEMELEKPNFDTEVLAPLRAKQATRAEEARQAELAARQKRVVVVKTAAVRIASGDVWESLRKCEAGGDYTKNTGNGYFGAYQYNLSTWANFMGYSRPDLAPPAVQDAKARETQARRGWSPWPACARKLGLL